MEEDPIMVNKHAKEQQVADDLQAPGENDLRHQPKAPTIPDDVHSSGFAAEV